jgi:UDP-N-acetyl-2-amino-2-deoxyglucuronate dehydrogenase
LAEKLRFGILGCGVIGPHHAKAIAGLGDAELVAVADEVPEKAGNLADEYDCARYNDLSYLLSDSDIDAICICTPSGMHAEEAIAALEAGKHVAIEKPVDITLEAVDRLLAVQHATDRKVAVVS